MKFLRICLFIMSINLIFAFTAYAGDIKAGEPSPVTVMPNGTVAHGQNMCEVTVRAKSKKWITGGFILAIDGNLTRNRFTPSRSVQKILIPGGQHYICLSDKYNNNHGGKRINIKQGSVIVLP